MIDRDRDDAGRALNARPRDGLGRPLPRGSKGGVERQPESRYVSPAQTLAEAQHLIDIGRPFHAHEVLEDAWKATSAPDRELWRGLAQIAVGVTHAARGNRSGALTLLRRGAATVVPFIDSGPAEVDIGALLVWVDESIHAVELECPTVLVSPPLIR